MTSTMSAWSNAALIAVGMCAGRDAVHPDAGAGQLDGHRRVTCTTAAFDARYAMTPPPALMPPIDVVFTTAPPRAPPCAVPRVASRP